MKILAYGLFFAAGASLWTLVGWGIAQSPHAALAFTVTLCLALVIYIALWLLDDLIAVQFLDGDRAVWAGFLIATAVAFVAGSLVLLGAVR